MPGLSAELQILEVERKALVALQRAFDDYEQREGQPPSTLIKLLGDVHGMILKRLQKRIGLTSASVDDLRGMAIELAKEQANVQQMIEQQERSAGLH